MFLSYLASFILLGFVFRLLLALMAIPLALMLAFTGRGSDEHPVWPAAVNQAIICVAYAGFLAVISAIYAEHEAVQYPWLYGVAGFIATYFALGSNAHSKAEASRQVFSWPTPEEEAAATGAGIGFLAGLLAYPAFFLWPAVVGLIPGVPMFFTWVIGVADWLSGFWIVRIILGFTLLGYIFSAGMMAVVGGAMLAFAGFGAIGRLLGFRKAA